MAGIRLWRCSRCEQVASVVVDAETTLLCGDCFYRKTVDAVMAAAFEAPCNTSGAFLHFQGDGTRAPQPHRRLG